MGEKNLFFNIWFIYFLLLFTIPILLMFQGLDITDTGWVLSNYQHIFKDPESVSYWFHLWLPNIVGGAWNLLFPDFGLISYRLAGVLIFWVTSFLVYLIYKDILPKEYILLGLVLGMVFHFAGKITVIHYNNLTTLFLVLGVYILNLGLKNNSNTKIFFAGFIFALNGFVRLPNILGILFVSIIIYHMKKKKQSVKKGLPAVILFIMGGCFSLAVAVGIMSILGHLPIYWESVKALLISTREEFSHYKSTSLEKKFFYDHARALFSSFILLLVFYFINNISIYKKHYSIRLLFHAGMALLVLGSTYFILYSESMVLVYPMVGLIYLTCLFIVGTLGVTFHDHTLIAYSVVISLGILSIGSDTGMKVASYGLLLGFPLLFWFWRFVPDIHISYETNLDRSSLIHSRYCISQFDRRRILMSILFLYVAFSIPLLYRDTYRDHPDRWRMNRPVSHPLLKGIFTTSERAVAIEELLSVLTNYVKPGDFLLTYESIPMIHYLTKTRSYVYNPWSILYLPTEYEKALQKARVERRELPVVVLSKTQSRSPHWPNSGPVSSTETAKMNRKHLYAYLDQNNYRTVWENRVFKVLIP